METTRISTLPLAAKTDDNRRLLQLVSLLLQYPDPEWLQIGELRAEVDEVAHPQAREALQRFLAYLESEEIDQLAQKYVETFDFNPNAALYLTYSAMGEERERGAILVRLKEFYAEAGFEVIADELPDYLPVLLEFAAVAPDRAAKKVLRDFRKPMENLRVQLKKTESPYAWVMQACLLASDPILK